MASIILRPVADSNLQHSCSSGSSGYALINEATADDDSTYIYQTIAETSSANIASEFKLSSSEDIGKFKIVKFDIYVRTRTTKTKTNDSASLTCSFYFSKISNIASGKTYTSVNLSTSYSTMSWTRTASETEVTDDVYSNLSKLNARIVIRNVGAKSASKNDSFQNRTTQVYAVLEYTPVSDASGTGIYLKQNGAYTQAQAAYKKVNGVWVQQTDIATLKTEMQPGKYKVST